MIGLFYYHTPNPPPYALFILYYETAFGTQAAKFAGGIYVLNTVDSTAILFLDYAIFLTKDY